MKTIVLDDAAGGTRTAVAVRRLLVAGYTGRDAAAVARHVDELARAGVPRPPSTPTCYPLDPQLLTQSEVVVAAGSNTSGEVEPVLVVAGGRRLLTVGSDHTDRELERGDVAAAKAACPKVVGTTAVDLAAVPDGAWDAVALRSTLADGSRYQDGTLAELLHPDELLARLGLELAEGDVLFLGTVPAIGGLRPSPSFAASMQIPDGPSLGLAYRTVDCSGVGGRPMAKPEIEFTSVEEAPWEPVAGVPGQAERILAADAATGVVTRMLRFDPGCDTSHLGVLRHDFWEEVHILSGSLHDLTLDQVFGPGTYACRPPGMPHGPWHSPEGCVTFEVRYPAR